MKTESEILIAIGGVVERELAVEGGLDVGKLTMDSRLVEDLALDSIQLLSLAVGVEDHFRICLDEEDEVAIVTVGDLVRAVRGKLDAA